MADITGKKINARDIVFHVGDILYDENLQDIMVLLECDYTPHETRTTGGNVTGVSVWQMWSSRDGAQWFSEFGLQNLVYLDIFAMYRADACGCCDWCGGRIGKF